MRNMTYTRLIQPLLAALFILQLLVVYIDSYAPGDCADKAMYFYTAMYATAPAETRIAFETMVAPFIRAFESDPRWPRMDFKLRSAVFYPLANVAIAFFHDRNRTLVRGKCVLIKYSTLWVR